MQDSRRRFLKHIAGVASVLLGGTQLVGCLGESDTQQPGTSEPAVQSGSDSPTEQPVLPAGSTSPGPTQMPANAAPVWQPSPAIEFVEGVPAVVPIRNFVNDPDGAALLITLNSGALLPGITWNPIDATLAYDGRPLGAKADAPVVVTGITFAADDRMI